MFRAIMWGLTAVIAVLLAGLSMCQRTTDRESEQASAGNTMIAGPFKLTSHKGEVIDNARLAGKPYLVFFGFTNCPDVCPTTLSELTGLLAQLGSDADKLTPLFITVDPERDSREVLADYMSSFDPRILALRGNESETAAAVKALRAYYKKVPTEGGEYTMDHTAGVIMMDAHGEFVGMLDPRETQQSSLAKLKRLVGV